MVVLSKFWKSKQEKMDELKSLKKEIPVLEGRLKTVNNIKINLELIISRKRKKMRKLEEKLAPYGLKKCKIGEK